VIISLLAINGLVINGEGRIMLAYYSIYLSMMKTLRYRLLYSGKVSTRMTPDTNPRRTSDSYFLSDSRGKSTPTNPTTSQNTRENAITRFL
jgi:hypothetical protein